MPQLLTSTILWDISANYLDVSNNLNVNGNTSLVGNVTTSNITGFAGQSSLVRISGNLIIPSGLSSNGIGAGQLRFNPTLLALQFYNGTAWISLGSSDSFDFLVIAGGGGGGNGVYLTSQAGGGGAGGYRTTVTGNPQGGLGTLDVVVSIVTSQTYTITVGNGGASNSPGQNSSIVGGATSIISIGGGSGKGSDANANGGSGGGGKNDSAAGGTGTPNQGFDGGAYGGPNRAGGGGGGGAVGASGVVSGNGGAGNASTITGISVVRGGGGGGANGQGGGQGGAGGGGTGSQDVANVGQPGTANTGGGGGGGGSNPAPSGSAGGAGGSGVVIIRTTSSVNTATLTGGGTFTTYTGYKVYTFLTNGTITWT